MIIEEGASPREEINEFLFESDESIQFRSVGVRITNDEGIGTIRSHQTRDVEEVEDGVET